MSKDKAAMSRRSIHLRRIHCEAFARDDGLIDIEGLLIDTKPMPLRFVTQREVPPQTPIHQMRLRLTIDRDQRIVDAQSFSEATPYADCTEVEGAYRQLIGLRIEPGFTREVKRLFRGPLGCTHMTELLGPMASTVFQVLWADSKFEPGSGADDAQRPSPIGGCHALRPDGQIVRTYFAQHQESAS